MRRGALVRKTAVFLADADSVAQRAKRRQKTCSGKQRKVEMSLLSNLTARRGSMLISYKQVLKADGGQLLDLKRDTLVEAGIATDRIYQDLASGRDSLMLQPREF